MMIVVIAIVLAFVVFDALLIMSSTQKRAPVYPHWQQFAAWCPACKVGAGRHFFKAKTINRRKGVACYCSRCGELLSFDELPGRIGDRRRIARAWNLRY